MAQRLKIGIFPERKSIFFEDTCGIPNMAHSSNNNPGPYYFLKFNCLPGFSVSLLTKCNSIASLLMAAMTYKRGNFCCFPCDRGFKRPFTGCTRGQMR